MGNTGLLKGMGKEKWRDYTPQLDVWPGGTTPQIGGQADGGQMFGRYLRTPTLVHAQVFIGFGNPGGSTPPVPGVGNYIVKLPVPCKPNVQGKSTPGSDRLLGYGNLNRLFGLAYELPLTNINALASDYPGQTYGGQARDWAALWCSHVYCRGTDSIPTTAASKAVTFPFTLPYAPNAEDIIVQLTSNPTTLVEGSGTISASTVAVSFPKTLTYTPTASDINVMFTSSPTASSNHGHWITGISTTGFTLNLNAGPTTPATFTYTVDGLGATPWVTGVSTTGFTLNLPSSPTTAAAFSYKVDTPNALLVRHNAPFAIGNGGNLVFDSLFLVFSYEPDA